MSWFLKQAWLVCWKCANRRIDGANAWPLRLAFLTQRGVPGNEYPFQHSDGHIEEISQYRKVNDYCEQGRSVIGIHFLDGQVSQALVSAQVLPYYGANNGQHNPHLHTSKNV